MNVNLVSGLLFHNSLSCPYPNKISKSWRILQSYKIRIWTTRHQKPDSRYIFRILFFFSGESAAKTNKNLCGRAKTILGNKRSLKCLWKMGLERFFRAGGRVSLSLNKIQRPAWCKKQQIVVCLSDDNTRWLTLVLLVSWLPKAINYRRSVMTGPGKVLLWTCISSNKTAAALWIKSHSELRCFLCRVISSPLWSDVSEDPFCCFSLFHQIWGMNRLKNRMPTKKLKRAEETANRGQTGKRRRLEITGE